MTTTPFASLTSPFAGSALRSISGIEVRSEVNHHDYAVVKCRNDLPLGTYGWEEGDPVVLRWGEQPSRSSRSLQRTFLGQIVGVTANVQQNVTAEVHLVGPSSSSQRLTAGSETWNNRSRESVIAEVAARMGMSAAGRTAGEEASTVTKSTSETWWEFLVRIADEAACDLVPLNTTLLISRRHDWYVLPSNVVEGGKLSGLDFTLRSASQTGYRQRRRWQVQYSDSMTGETHTIGEAHLRVSPPDRTPPSSAIPLSTVSLGTATYAEARARLEKEVLGDMDTIEAELSIPQILPLAFPTGALDVRLMPRRRSRAQRRDERVSEMAGLWRIREIVHTMKLPDPSGSGGYGKTHMDLMRPGLGEQTFRGTGTQVLRDSAGTIARASTDPVGRAVLTGWAA